CQQYRHWPQYSF
nr:immunoglobulin light chain junction region [Macaca mulatta]